jgi:glycosyltransferase involved in cell wall biosynthesis
MTSNPLNLAVDVGPLHGHRTGVGVAVAGIVGALARRDDVELERYLVSFRAASADRQRKLPLPGSAASHLWSRFDRPRADRWLRGTDVVHGTNYVAPPSALPTVISVYDCWFMNHPELATPVVRRAGATLRRAVARGAWIHSSSDATTEIARELLGTERIATVHLGAPATPPPLDELPRPPIASTVGGRPVVLAIATEERRKDLPLLVEAFAGIAARQPDMHLVMAGARGDQSDEIGAAVDALPASVRVRLHRLGPVDDATKHWLLRQARVLAYPSLDEGFGFPILEAQSVGTPVVAIRAGAIGEIAGQGAILVDTRDAEALAAGIEQIHSSGIERLGLIEAGHRNLARFRWGDTAEGLVELYRRARDEST